MDQAHEDVPDPCTVQGLVEQAVLSVQDQLGFILPISGKRSKSTIDGIHTTVVVCDCTSNVAAAMVMYFMLKLLQV